MPDRSVVVRLIADTGGYREGMRSAAQDTRRVGDAGEETGNRLEGLKGVLAGIGVGSFVKLGVDLNSLKQQATASFTTITGSASSARSELTLLQKQFGSSMFGFENVVKAGQRLSALNIPLSDVNKILGSISDAASATGGGPEEFDRISMSLGQMVSKGKVQAEEMLQLAEAQIPAWQLLADEIGTSIPEAMAKVQRGEVSGLAGVRALTDGMADRFEGATERMANTWPATLARLKAAAEQASGDVVEPLMRIGAQGAEAMQPLLHQVGNVGKWFADLPSPIQNTALAMGAVAVFSGRLNTMWGGLTRGAGSFRQEMQNLQRSHAMIPGQTSQMSSFSAAARVAGSRVGNLGRGIAGAFGGPAGLAIAGGVLALSLWQDRQQKAAAAVAQHKQDVESLTAAIDKNSLSLNAQGQGEIDKFLADKGTVKQFQLGGDGPQGGDVKFVQDKSILDYLNKYKISADLARRAILGNKQALAQLKRELSSKGVAISGGANVLAAIEGKAKDLGQAIGITADQFRTRLEPAARASGLSVDQLGGAIDKSARDGSDLALNIQAAGGSASQAAAAAAILQGNTAGAGAAARGMAYDFAAAKGAIAEAAGSFINVTGAWDAAVQANTPTGGGGGGATKAAKQKPLPRLTDDPAYRKAKKAEDDFERAQKKQGRLDDDRVRSAKKVAEADSDAAKAATERAQATRDAADAAADAARDAEDALKKAQDQKEQADRNARDAAALAVAVRAQAGRAGTADQAAWSRAMSSAGAAASSTAATRASANAGLGAAQSDFMTKDAAAKAAKRRADVDEAVAKAAKKRAEDSAKAVDEMQDRIDDREYASERFHERLTARREKAEKNFNKRLDRLQKERDESTSTSNSAVSSGYASTAKSVSASLADYLKQLRGQVTAQDKWKSDLLLLAAKIPPGMVAELAKLGPQAAPLIGKLASGSKTQLKEFVTLFGKAGTDAGTGVSTQLTAAIPLISAAASSAGSSAASKLAEAIRTGRTTVASAMKNLTKNGVNLSLGLKNKAEVERYINSLSTKRVQLHAVVAVNKVVDKQGKAVGFSVGAGGGLKFFERGGWVTGGSGMRDDVHIPMNRTPGLMAKGGEFMVTQEIAQKNKPFFDEMDRTGRMPQQRAQVFAPQINIPAQAPGRTVINHITVMQHEGQSMRDTFREVDRLADMGMGPA